MKRYRSMWCGRQRAARRFRTDAFNNCVVINRMISGQDDANIPKHAEHPTPAFAGGTLRTHC